MAAAEETEVAGNATYQSDHMDAIFQEGFSFSGFERNFLARNLGGRYLDISGVSGADSISDGRGSLFADLDNDGDLDIFVVAMQREAHGLLRNNVGSRSGFLRVELVGGRSGRDAFGTVVRVKTSAGTLTKLKSGGSGFLSQGDPRLLFGLRDDVEAEWVEVTWPGGARQRWERVPAGTVLRVQEGESEFETIAERRFALPDPATPEDVRMARLRFRRGDPFPPVRLHRLGGEPVALADAIPDGRRAYVNLWATYCVPCRVEMPALQELLPQFDRAGVELVGVSVDLEETAARIPAFLEKYGIGYPIYTAAAGTVPRIFSGDDVVIPISFLLDENGRVVRVLEGWSEAIRGEVLRFLGSTDVDPSAQAQRDPTPPRR